MSFFGGPAWTFDDTTSQYYLHLFLPEQPDLNWQNKRVRAEFDAILEFWLDRGVDGFRVDVAQALMKDQALRSNPQVEWFEVDNRDVIAARRGHLVVVMNSGTTSADLPLEGDVVFRTRPVGKEAALNVSSEHLRIRPDETVILDATGSNVNSRIKRWIPNSVAPR